ncbi:MAG TPA: hypothetical protein VFN78_14685 [Ktedonobacterales bacterium]|nr:hypothetical protein [Ktedonobacterales bacterium]
MRRRSWSLGVVLGCVALIALLIACSAVVYEQGIAASVGYSAYSNTSPPVASSAGGVTLRLAHSRYLTIETFTLSLTNQSGAPIYLPATGAAEASATATFRDLEPDIDGTLSDYANLCLAIGSEVRNARGWQPRSQGCDWARRCPEGAPPPLQRPVMLVIAPGDTAEFPVYDGQRIYPPWSPGVYHFSALYTLKPFLAPGDRKIAPEKIPGALTLTTPPVMLTSAWWYPSSYHQQRTPCPPVA